MNHRVKGAGIGNGVWQRGLRCLLPRIGCEGKGLGSEDSQTSQFPRILHSGYPAFSRGWVTRTASYPQTGRGGEAEKQIATQNSLGEPEKLVTQNPPPAQGTGGDRRRAKVRCVPGMLTGNGSLPRFLHGGYFGARGIQTSRGGEKAPSAPREIPVSLLRPRASSST